MKIQSITYNNFIEIVKEKINSGSIKPHVKRVNRDGVTKTRTINEKELLDEIKKFFKKIRHHNYIVNISFHQKTKTYVIKIIDKETKQVVREAPLEKILDMISFMEEKVFKKKTTYRGL